MFSMPPACNWCIRCIWRRCWEVSRNFPTRYRWSWSDTKFTSLPNTPIRTLRRWPWSTCRPFRPVPSRSRLAVRLLGHAGLSAQRRRHSRRTVCRDGGNGDLGFQLSTCCSSARQPIRWRRTMPLPTIRYGIVIPPSPRSLLWVRGGLGSARRLCGGGDRPQSRIADLRATPAANRGRPLGIFLL